MHEISGEFFIFQQDRPHARQTCEVISLLDWKIPAFISLDLRLPRVQIWLSTEFTAR